MDQRVGVSISSERATPYQRISLAIRADLPSSGSVLPPLRQPRTSPCSVAFGRLTFACGQGTGPYPAAPSELEVLQPSLTTKLVASRGNPSR